MPTFGQRSLENLATADPKLQRLFNEVIKHFDCLVTQGHRGEADQNAAFAAGKSKLKWPDGNHNAMPSRAVDVYPFPYEPNNTNRILYFAGVVMGIAAQMGIGIRWGGDWDRDTDLSDNRFNDLVHFELSKEEK